MTRLLIALFAVVGVLAAAWTQELPGMEASLSPASGLTVTRDGHAVWGGRLGVSADNDPALTFDADVCGSVLSESYAGRTWHCSRTLGASTCIATAAGDDVQLDFTLRTKTPVKWFGIVIGGSAGPKNWESHVLTAVSRGEWSGIPVPQRTHRFWPGAHHAFRCVAWRTPTASYAVSIAGNDQRRVVFSEIADGRILVIVEADLQASQELRVPVRIRVAAADAPLATLLGRYVADFRSAFGPQRYTADHRPVVQLIRFAAHHGVTPTPDNPHGFTFGFRPDTEPVAAHAVIRSYIDDATRNGFQGAIAWGWAWSRPHSQYWGYPVDSYDLPTPARELYDGFFAGPMGTAGLRWGCLQRAAVEQLENAAGPVWLPVDGSSHAGKRLAARLTRAGKLHYVDTTPDVAGVENNGATPSETALAFAAARTLCGPEPQWYLESGLDLLLPHAGLYWEVRNQTVPAGIIVARLLYPECGILTKDRDGRPVGDFRRWCDERKFAALVEDWRVGAAAP